MQNWVPRKGEKVFSTPQDVPGFNHLTRLEEIRDASHDWGYITVSNRHFKFDLVSTDDTSLEYGILELRQATPELLTEWNHALIAQSKADSLILLDWPQFISDLDSSDLTILHEAVQRIRSRHLPLEIAPEIQGDTTPIAWLYFKIPPPLWCPIGTRYLIQNLEDDYFAVDLDGRINPVKSKAAVEAAVSAGLLTHHYEPDDSLKWQPV